MSIFDDKHGALIPFRREAMPDSRRDSRMERFGEGMLRSVDENIREVARSLVHSDEPFEISMAKLQIEAWQERRGLVKEWRERKRQAEDRLYESFLRYHRGLLPEGEALDLLAQAEGLSPERLRSDYRAFREFLGSHGDRLGAAQRVLAEQRLHEKSERKNDLKDQLKEAERRARATLR